MTLRAAFLPAFAILLAGCPSDPDPEPEWRIVADLEVLPSGLISVWGTSATDVWTVGADADGTGPYVLHYDGASWSRIATGITGVDLWWVHGFAGGPVFAGGTEGTILRIEGTTVTPMTTPGMNTVFGIWGTSPTDVWAVGGALGATGGGFTWHYDGTTWSDVPLPAGFPDMDVVFKVWGRASGDVWFVGTHGRILHWNGTAFAEESATGTSRTLFTTHMDSDTIVAVGGFGTGVLLENDGTGWRDVVPPSTSGLLGVWLSGNDEGYAVGESGEVVRRTATGWAEEDHGLALAENLHAVWVDPDGGVWAVGGQLAATPPRDGIILHRSVEAVATPSF